MIRSSTIRHGLAAALTLCVARAGLAQDSTHPFGTLREQAEIQQHWLEQRLETYLPALMRKYGIDMWVVPMREYNEDPVFEGIAAPTTFAARRRTIYVFFDRGPEKGVERIALGGGSQGGVFTAVRTTKEVNGVAGRTAELWGDQQWEVLKETMEARQPKIIGINKSRIFAFSDGLSSGELEGMSQALGKKWTSRFRPAEGLAVDFLALRLPEEREVYAKMQDLVWQMIRTMFSSQLITPGVTRTSELVWWWRQHLNDLGLGTWFQPSVEIQRRGANAEQLGDDPIIERGDLLWCDVGITALRLNTDTQHDAYVLQEGETDAPAGLKQALANSNRLQDLLFEEIRPGRTGNEVLKAVLTRMRAEGLDGTLYSHPIGLNGHGAGPLIGLWDYQEGVPGRGDHKVLANMWFSSELQVTSEVPEWDGQRVRMAQEEDFAIGADGKPFWIKGRQSELILVH